MPLTPNQVISDMPDVYEGYLAEDFIETVKSCGKPYLDVILPDFWVETAPHPLTRVPLSAHHFLYPLRKGDTVRIIFPDRFENNLYFPELYCALTEIVPVWSSYSAPPAGQITSFPASTKPVFSYDIYTSDNYRLYLDDAIITHVGDTVVQQSPTGVFVFSKGKYNAYIKGDYGLEVNGKFQSLVGGDKRETVVGNSSMYADGTMKVTSKMQATFGTSAYTVGQALLDLIDILVKNPFPFTVVGNPMAAIVMSENPLWKGFFVPISTKIKSNLG